MSQTQLGGEDLWGGLSKIRKRDHIAWAVLTVAARPTGRKRNVNSRKSTTRALASNTKEEAYRRHKCKYNKTADFFHRRWS